LAGYWANRRRDARAGLGVGAISGVLIGEGIYGLAFIADTTYMPYWWGETVAGVVLGACLVARRPSSLRNAGAAVTVAALTAVAFIAVYSQDLIGVLP